MANDQEIEVQLKVENIKPLVKLLEKDGKFLGEVRQIDEYFTPVHRNFADKDPIEEWLRVRKSNDKFSITYKNWHYDQSGRSEFFADEFETSVGDISAIKKMFSALDFKPLVTVKKIRKTYLYKDLEITLDAIDNIGDFIEIEWKGGKTSQEKALKEIRKFLAGLKLGKLLCNNVGYAYMALYPDREIEMWEF